MRKFVVLTGILFLVFGMVAVNQVYATDVTIPDTLTGAGGWNSYQTAENNETEPGTLTGQIWDLESFNNKNAGKDLTLIGGFNFLTGATNDGSTYKSGDVFLSTTGSASFGGNSPSLSYVDSLHTTGNAQIKNNFGWNYVVQFDLVAGTYKVISIDSSAILLKTAYDTGTFLDTNPWQYYSGGTVVETGKIATFTTLASDGEGAHYEVTLAGLLGLNEFKNAADILAFFTYRCGNDIMVGETVGSGVPLPPSALLLGTGLLGLVGLGWRRRQTKV